MNSTRRGYPYPQADCTTDQCTPPLIRDAADLPAQLLALATAVDADLTAINDQVVGETSGPAAEILSNSTQVLGTNQGFTLDTIVADQGGMADVTNSRLIVPTSGLYLITASGNKPSSTAVGFLRLSIVVDGVPEAWTTVKPAATVGDICRISASMVRVCSGGEFITLAQRQEANDSWDRARLSAVRLMVL